MDKKEVILDLLRPIEKGNHHVICHRRYLEV